MSKVAAALGLIVGGLALAMLAGPVGIIAMSGNLHAMIGLGLTAAISGVGLALHQTPTQVGTSNSIGFAQGISPRRVIYGQFQTAGVLTYASFPPSQNLALTSQYLHLVYTIAAHEIASFDAVIVNGYIYNFGTDILKDSSLTDTPWEIHPFASVTPNDFYFEHMMFEFDFGTPSQGQQPFPNLAASDPSWTSACLQRGCAKVHVILRADNGWPNIYPSGQIPNIQFLVTGKKLIDPRVVTAWAASTNYTKYQYVLDNNGNIWVEQNAGVCESGTSRPNFESHGLGSTIGDGTCSWTCTWTLANAFIGGGTPQLDADGKILINDGWQPSTSIGTPLIIESPPGYLQQLLVGGATGSSRPAFSTDVGGATSDGAVTWVCLGRSPYALNPSNAALCVYDYLMDSDAGIATPAAAIDTASVIAAANVCEEQALIIWNADGTKVYENLYSCNGSFDHSSTRGNVLQALLAAMAGTAVPPGDFWHIFAGAYVTPTASLTDSDLRGAIKGDFRLSRRDVANSIQGTYNPAFLPANPPAAISLTSVPGTWQSQSFPAYQANGQSYKPNYIATEDGGQIIWQDVHFEFVSSVWQAQRLAKITLMRLRFQQTLTLPFKLTAFVLEAGDTFEYTHPNWNLTNAIFEVTQCSLALDLKGPTVGVDLIARETDPSIYSFTPPQSSIDCGEYSPFGVTGVMSGVE